MLKLKNVHKKYHQNNHELPVLRDINIHVKEGEFVAIVGASGCGKSTLLRMITGLEETSGGTISLLDSPIQGPHKDRGMVFQHFALFPWLTVSENILFGLRVRRNSPPAPLLRKRGEKRSELRRCNSQVLEYYLRITGLSDYKDAYPHTLSGGMQQRVAIARTLANNPKLVCMDEPFGALDVLTRAKMQEFLLGLWEKDKKTVVFVTHDIEEALVLADRILVFGSGEGVKREIEVPFSRPRMGDLRYTPDFIELKKEITSLIS